MIKKIFLVLLFICMFYTVQKTLIEKNYDTIIYEQKDLISSKNNNRQLEEISKILIYKKSSNITYLFNNIEEEIIVDTPIIKEENKDPVIYIYNTHDKENYSKIGLENYNIDANVVTASYILQEQLKKYGIVSLVEERSPTSLVSKNKLEYKDTYDFSRKHALEIKEKYPSIKIFIDLHRDGVSKSISTANINEENYARLMFLLGMNHKESAKNLEFVKELENYLNNEYKGILRNTYFRKEYAYNQDISTKSFIIEVGGQDNTIEEVYNSMVAFADCLAYYLGDNYE